MINGVIVFDFDGTLYDISCVREMMYRVEEDFLCGYAGMSRDEAKSFMIAEKIITPNPSEARSATECFQKMGIGPQLWARYRTEHFDVECVEPSKAVASEVIEGFRNFGELMLLSSNTIETIHRIMERIHVSPEIFSEIVCSSNSQSRKFSKYDFFSNLISSMNINAKHVLSIGDRYMTDIYPLLRLGGRGILVKGPFSLRYILDDMNSGNLLTNSQAYTYYA